MLYKAYAIFNRWTKRNFSFYVNYSNFSPSVMLIIAIKYFNNIIYSHLHKTKQYTLNRSLVFEIRNSFETKNKFNNKVQMGIKKQLEIFNLTYDIILNIKIIY